MTRSTWWPMPCSSIAAETTSKCSTPSPEPRFTLLELEHWIDQAPVDLWHRLATFGRRGNLIHAGRTRDVDREARLDRFLARQPGWREREIAQRGRGILARVL